MEMWHIFNMQEKPKTRGTLHVQFYISWCRRRHEWEITDVLVDDLWKGVIIFWKKFWCADDLSYFKLIFRRAKDRLYLGIRFRVQTKVPENWQNTLDLSSITQLRPQWSLVHCSYFRVCSLFKLAWLCLVSNIKLLKNRRLYRARSKGLISENTKLGPGTRYELLTIKIKTLPFTM